MIYINNFFNVIILETISRFNLFLYCVLLYICLDMANITFLGKSQLLVKLSTSAQLEHLAFVLGKSNFVDFKTMSKKHPK